MENQSVIMYTSSNSSTCSNKVRNSCSSSDSLLVKHGGSKAQMSLKKIIDIISSGSSENKKIKDTEKKRGLGIDLNLRLGCFDTDNDVNGFSSDCSGVIGGGGGGERVLDNGENNVEFTSGSVKNCDLKGDIVDVIEVGEDEEERRELSEVTDLETPEIEEKEDGGVVEELVVVEKGVMITDSAKGYMDLLVEAARLISGDFADETDEEEEENKRENLDEEKVETKRRRSKRNVKCDDVYEDFEDISPVVKSKRGRNQVLPLRYRDSVLDPWKSTKKRARSSRVSNRNRN